MHTAPAATRIGRDVFLVGWLVVVFVLGCSRGYEDNFSRARPPVFKATGRVTWNGEPTSGVLVSLSSKSENLASSGFTDEEGNFTLTTWRVGDGAVAGEHAVAVQKIVVVGHAADGSPIEANCMPPKYGNPETSGLKATIVEQGPNELSFEVIGPRAAVTPPVMQPVAK